MARSAPRPCGHPGCGRLVYGASRCPAHAAQKASVDAQYHAAKYGKASERGYDSAWRRMRDKVMASNPLCACGRPARLVHHLKPLREGGERLAEENLVPVCHACHERTHKGAR